MATKVVMEALSPTMEEGRVVNWLKSEGDTVASGDTLAEVETDKAVMELVARGDGILRKVIVGEGETVEVGSLVAVIAGADEDISTIINQNGEPAGSAMAAPAKSPEPQTVRVESAPPTAATPAAAPSQTGGRIKASPLARKMARDRGLDLSTLSGSGPGGRIIKRDLERATAAPTAGAPPAGGFEDVPLTQIRKTIARRLIQSLGPVPHFFLTTEIDMERAWDQRKALNELDDGPRVSFNDIILKAVALALTAHRECNAWWQDDHIRYFSEVHLGMAVAIDDGLITPVIRNAHAKSLREIATESSELVERARNRKLKPEEYTGSTFSVSNLGMLGIDQFTAVINPPEAGIIAIGAIEQKPVVYEGSIVPRRRMRITMSCDHRVIDGATGARFLQTVTRMLENPLAMVW